MPGSGHARLLESAICTRVNDIRPSRHNHQGISAAYSYRLWPCLGRAANVCRVFEVNGLGVAGMVLYRISRAVTESSRDWLTGLVFLASLLFSLSFLFLDPEEKKKTTLFLRFSYLAHSLTPHIAACRFLCTVSAYHAPAVAGISIVTSLARLRSEPAHPTFPASQLSLILNHLRPLL